MRWLEQVVIDVLRRWAVRGLRQRGMTGIWVDVPGAAVPAKIGALGVRVERNVTLHGLALNVAPRLEHFETIVPCGLHGRTVTSLAQCLGPGAPTMAAVKPWLAAMVQHHWQARCALHAGV